MGRAYDYSQLLASDEIIPDGEIVTIDWDETEDQEDDDACNRKWVIVSHKVVPNLRMLGLIDVYDIEEILSEEEKKQRKPRVIKVYHDMINEETFGNINTHKG